MMHDIPLGAFARMALLEQGGIKIKEEFGRVGSEGGWLGPGGKRGHVVFEANGRLRYTGRYARDALRCISYR